MCAGGVPSTLAVDCAGAASKPHRPGMRQAKADEAVAAVSQVGDRQVLPSQFSLGPCHDPDLRFLSESGRAGCLGRRAAFQDFATLRAARATLCVSLTPYWFGARLRLQPGNPGLDGWQ